MAVIGVELQPVHPPSREMEITPPDVSKTLTIPSWASKMACTGPTESRTVCRSMPVMISFERGVGYETIEVL